MHYTCDLDHIGLGVQARNKKDLYRRIGGDLQNLFQDLYLRELFQKIIVNEQTYSFSAGQGVAIVNATLNNLDHASHLFYRLNSPLNFETLDNQKVDLVMVLLSPEEDGPLHLRRLSRLTRLLQQENFVKRLRETSDAAVLRSLFIYGDLLEEKAA